MTSRRHHRDAVPNEEGFIEECVRQARAQDTRRSLRDPRRRGGSTDARANPRPALPPRIRAWRWSRTRRYRPGMNEVWPRRAARASCADGRHADYAPDTCASARSLERTGADNAGGAARARAKTRPACVCARSTARRRRRLALPQRRQRGLGEAVSMAPSAAGCSRTSASTIPRHHQRGRRAQPAHHAPAGGCTVARDTLLLPRDTSAASRAVLQVRPGARAHALKHGKFLCWPGDTVFMVVGATALVATSWWQPFTRGLRRLRHGTSPRRCASGAAQASRNRGWAIFRCCTRHTASASARPRALQAQPAGARRHEKLPRARVEANARCRAA